SKKPWNVGSSRLGCGRSFGPARAGQSPRDIFGLPSDRIADPDATDLLRVHRDQTGVMSPRPNRLSRGRNRNNPHPNPPRTPHPTRPLIRHRIQNFERNGPDVKIRGNYFPVFERYVGLAREAAVSGDRLEAENFYQHAEHYFRLLNANGVASRHGAQRPITPA